MIGLLLPSHACGQTCESIGLRGARATTANRKHQETDQSEPKRSNKQRYLDTSGIGSCWLIVADPLYTVPFHKWTLLLRGHKTDPAMTLMGDP